MRIVTIRKADLKIYEIHQFAESDKIVLYPHYTLAIVCKNDLYTFSSDFLISYNPFNAIFLRNEDG